MPLDSLTSLEQAYAELTWNQEHGGLTSTQELMLSDVKYQLACYYLRQPWSD